MKITKRTIDTLRPAADGTEVFVWDTDLRGFGVRMMPSGAGAYIVQYRTPEGRTRRLAIGKLGTLTPAEARDLARDKLRDAAKGSDPSAERRALRNAITVGELCDLYVKDAEGRVKASTIAMDKSRIETHVKPLIGRRAVPALTREDIEHMQADIAAGKTATTPKRDKKGKRKGRGGIAAGGPAVAARTVGMLGTILEFARRRKLISENPARGIKRLPEGKQRRFLSIDEIGELGKAMIAAELAGDNKIALAAIRLLLLTGLRRMEALGLVHDIVDRRAGCIRFEDTKSGAQIRPIGAAAVKVIEAQPVAEGCPWVFPAAHGAGHLIGLPKVLARVCRKAQLDGVTVHVLRHTFATVATELGYSELTIAGLLGHAVPGVTARYSHLADATLVSAASTVAARIAAVLDGETSEGKEIGIRQDSPRILQSSFCLWPEGHMPGQC